MTVWNYLKITGYKKKLNVWALHELMQSNLIYQITISETLLKCNKLKLFLRRIITGDKKWVKYENIKHKRSWIKAGDLSQTISKLGLLAKVMWSI